MVSQRHQCQLNRKLTVILTILLGMALLMSACSTGEGESAEGSSVDTNASESATPSGDAESASDDADGDATATVGFGDPNGTDPLAPLSDEVARPLVFVHGFAGSAQQYESQAMRFVANGYPIERIIDYDHDGAGMDIEGYAAGLGEVVDDALKNFDTDLVYLVGHSRGTRVVSEYLANPDNVAKVAKYIAIDGFGCVDVVPCLEPTQAMFRGQGHVEVASSPESFIAQYEFLIGETPDVVDIVAQKEPVEISGRAVEFPANTGREGVTLNIWSLDADTGHRSDDQPHATFELGPDGSFGPVQLITGGAYEYELTLPDSDSVHHLYMQPYLRSSRFVRLLSSDPDGPIRQMTNSSPDHTSLILMRMKEWYGTAPSPESPAAGIDGDLDEVMIAAAGVDPVNIITPEIGRGAIGLHLHDDVLTPAETTLAPLENFAGQPFQGGVDIYLPATADGSETISIINYVRGNRDNPQQINVPNWPSDKHPISVVFFDYPITP